METTEYILQWWHIVGFIYSFLCGGLFFYGLLSPWLRRADEELRKTDCEND